MQWEVKYLIQEEVVSVAVVVVGAKDEGLNHTTEYLFGPYYFQSYPRLYTINDLR